MGLKTEIGDRPKRWSVPYADEIAGASMSYRDVRDLLGDSMRLLARDQKRFPPDLPLVGILRHDTRRRTYAKGPGFYFGVGTQLIF